MSIFKHDREVKRMIFNVHADLADRLEELKAETRNFDKRLDVDGAVNKALDKFVKKAAKKLEELRHEVRDKRPKIHADASIKADSPKQDDSAPATHQPSPH